MSLNISGRGVWILRHSVEFWVQRLFVRSVNAAAGMQHCTKVYDRTIICFKTLTGCVAVEVHTAFVACSLLKRCWLRVRAGENVRDLYRQYGVA